MKKPITFYVDSAMPEAIRNAVKDGVSWWTQAFDAAGFENAFRVEVLPDGAEGVTIRRIRRPPVRRTITSGCLMVSVRSEASRP